MCGLSGFLDKNSKMDAEQAQNAARKMSETITHRGPDDADTWSDIGAGITISHRRLAIIDLSPSGRQPMKSRSQRYILAYNGEVYNFQLLRRELEPRGYHFRGGSDTEVILAAIEEWGVEKAVKKFVGMFAFALWDRKTRQLHLVRDRLGIKPLYYGWRGQTFMFASELRAIETYPEFDNGIDRRALALYLRFSYVPAPWSILSGIKKVMPGSILTTDGRGRNETSTTYWSLREVAEKGLQTPFRGSEKDATDRLEKLLREATRQRMIADVPLGVFLSGGIDSSTIAALMQSESTSPIKSFTIGFPDHTFDESNQATAVAAHLGTNHQILPVTGQDALDTIPGLPALCDEPFADSSQIPTYLVSSLARQQVKVCLSGDGGDEVFGGYNRYAWCEPIFEKLRYSPFAIRNLLGKSISALSSNTWNRLFEAIHHSLPEAWKLRDPGDKMVKLAHVLSSRNGIDAYKRLVSQWQFPADVAINCIEPLTIIEHSETWPNLPDLTRQMMYLDTMTYLPDDILAKLDRASMAWGLEARVPMLDHRVLEYAWSLPQSMKISKGMTKQILRRVLEKYVPAELTERPKWGFAIPLHEWLRGPLREWGEELLNEHRLKHQGLLKPEPIQEMWRQHQSGSGDWQNQLWNILVFQAWLDRPRADKLITKVATS